MRIIIVVHKASRNRFSLNFNFFELKPHEKSQKFKFNRLIDRVFKASKLIQMFLKKENHFPSIYFRFTSHLKHFPTFFCTLRTFINPQLSFYIINISLENESKPSPLDSHTNGT